MSVNFVLWFVVCRCQMKIKKNTVFLSFLLNFAGPQKPQIFGHFLIFFDKMIFYSLFYQNLMVTLWSLTIFFIFLIFCGKITQQKAIFFNNFSHLQWLVHNFFGDIDFLPILMCHDCKFQVWDCVIQSNQLSLWIFCDFNFHCVFKIQTHFSGQEHRVTSF